MLERLEAEKPSYVLAVQDTTSFNFAHHPATKGLGMINEKEEAGFFAHTTLAVSLEGVPLGLFAQEVWTRKAKKRLGKNAHQQVSITEKESRKWLNALYETNESPVAVITVADREADVYEFFQEVHNLGSDCIIRLSKNRRLAEEAKLFETLEAQPFVGTYEVEVARQRTEEGRVAQVSLRYSTVSLLPPKNRKLALQVIPLIALTVQVVEAVEIEAPIGVEPIHWLLLTTLPVASFEDARSVVRFYSYRWRVERFHYVLKSGCQIETSQLGSYEALTNFLALCSYQAWQLLELTYQARVQPEVSAETCLRFEEWQALEVFRSGQPQIHAFCPSLSEAVFGIAKLGGFVGRKSDGQPGLKVLWRGWSRLQDLVALWKIFHAPPQDVGKE